ncbi:hypothetical protein [Streptacidiphilus sp. EB129]|uniref:hypothetical protein n=1 Tax=Streptacidiphilus sp. EB129 TaxID=3156262 RepID=UPI0035195B21
MDLVLFVIAGAVETAEDSAAALLRRALASSGTGLVLDHCAVELFTPAAEALLGPDPRLGVSRQEWVLWAMGPDAPDRTEVPGDGEPDAW